MENILDKSECIVETRKWAITLLVDETAKKCIEILEKKAEKFWRKLNIIRDNISLYIPYWKNWVMFDIKYNQADSRFEFTMDHSYDSAPYYQKYWTIDDFDEKYQLFIKDILESYNFDSEAENAVKILHDSLNS